MKIEKNQVKKIIIIILIAFFALYFLWDISVKAANSFRSQGYELAIMQMMDQAENENCLPFDIYMGDKEISLINVECLQMADDGGHPITDEMIPEDDSLNKVE